MRLRRKCLVVLKLSYRLLAAVSNWRCGARQFDRPVESHDFRRLQEIQEMQAEPGGQCIPGQSRGDECTKPGGIHFLSRVESRVAVDEEALLPERRAS
jgi:hypothetical protein